MNHITGTSFFGDTIEQAVYAQKNPLAARNFFRSRKADLQTPASIS